jgi:hypothetical protein
MFLHYLFSLEASAPERFRGSHLQVALVTRLFCSTEMTETVSKRFSFFPAAVNNGFEGTILFRGRRES